MELYILAFTLVFGPLRLFTLTKIFTGRLCNPFEGIFAITNKSGTFLGGIIVWLDNAIFYASLLFQAYYWLTIIVGE